MENIESEMSTLRVSNPETPLQRVEREPNYFLSLVLGEPKPSEEELRTNMRTMMFYSEKYPEKLEEYQGSKGMFQICSGTILQAFLAAHWGDFDAATVINKSQRFITHCLTKGLMDADYKKGYNYLLKITEHYFSLKKNEVKEFSFPSYAELPSRGKAAVLSAKLMCQGSLLYRDDSKIVQELVSLDPTCWIWRYIMCKRERCKRRSEQKTEPSPAEKTAIIEAEKYVPDAYKMYCMASYIQCLAEILNWRLSNTDNWRTPGALEFGRRRFLDDGQIYKFIKETSDEIIGQETKTFGECLRIGEIFSSILPPKWRDYDLALRGFQQAMIIRPEGSTKFHHQFAKLYIGKKNVPEAIEQLKLSVARNRANFPAWSLLVVKLRESGQLQNIEVIIQDQMDHRDCTTVDLAKLQTFLGHYLLANCADRKSEGLVLIIGARFNYSEAWETLKKSQSLFGFEKIINFLDSKKNEGPLNPEEIELADYVRKNRITQRQHFRR